MSSRSSLHQRLAAQPALLGLLQTHPNPVISEMAGFCGYDFIVLDGEHGVFSETDYLHAFQALAAAKVAAVVRLARHDLQAVGRYMDMGADALMVPNVSTPAQALALARAMEYPPAGTRGFGAPGHRATRYGLDLPAHLQAPREGVSLLVMIESGEGVANVEDILAIGGVGGLFIGPSDLTAALGCARDFSQPTYLQAVARIERAAAHCGKLCGTAPHPGASVEALIARGHRLLIIGADTPLIAEAMRAQVAQAKASFALPGRI